MGTAQLAAEPWKRRFTAAQIGFPRWAAAAPDRLAVVTTESGVWQVWAIDLANGTRAQVSHDPVGVEDVLVAPDGRLVWWSDDTGNERGMWVARLFDGGRPHDLVPDVPVGWSTGISFADDTVAIGLATGSDYRVLVSEGGAPARELLRSERTLGVGCPYPEGAGGLSSDGRLVCVRHTDGGDVIREGLRVLDVRDGSVIGELRDPERGITPIAWAPGEGNTRLLFLSEAGAFERPALWDPTTGERRDLDPEIDGAVIPLGWWPDGSAILARHEHEGRDRLVRVDPDGDAIGVVADTGGMIPEAAVRPDGEVWLWTSASDRPPRVETADGREILRPAGDPPPPGRRYRPFWFDDPSGQRIQAFLATPDGAGPFPTIVSVHGGPEWHERESFDPETQAFVDAGFAVALVNYRGSTGYGVAFRYTLIGDPWLPEIEDVIACLDALVAEGIADPQRAGFAGWSWGGCLGCLTEGMHPDRWAAVFAGIPSGDSRAAHEAAMPEIQAYDVAIYGGGPDEIPERWDERDPMTFVHRAHAPVLVIAGEDDPRCPLPGIEPWVDAAREHGVDVEMITYPGGHHANATERRVQHMSAMLDFFRRNL